MPYEHFPMQALTDFTYHGRDLKAGDIFQPDKPVDALTLSYAHKAKFTTQSAPEPEKPKRRYKRRDLEPET